ncbi:(S)-mandelate dehydrogenase [Variovorax boronicumulans]|uniref:alpha-hydroxy acid oxidase n=1 Tax=Variovorax boronicumulans TaxID=436515 RepID=UPI0027868A04|nr:alpha-hydroxy acid oxidase [Variovorax boronicumulans]MDP9920899.1 (S)-mandelate dehydrogenase [Variovorax boronicumulans]
MAALAAVQDYRVLARKRLTRIASDYLEGGAEDLRTLARNRRAYDALLFKPRVLTEVTTVDAGVRVLDQTLAMPAVVGPTGLNGLYYPRAEEALATAAHRAGLPFVLSTASTSLLEDVRRASDGELWLQLYVQRDRSIAQRMMARARGAGYTVLMLTVDTPVHGVRDHDIRNGFKMPLRITPRLMADVMTHPRWCMRMLRQGGSPQLVNLARSTGMTVNLAAQAAAMSRQMDMSLNWADIDWLRAHWPGRLLVKGILSVDDALQARAVGVDGIVLSNHGGRQLESAPSPLELLPAVTQAVGSALTVMMDGGIRRGSDIVKARALGAQAVLLGRAPLYGLAARGPRGVTEVLQILRSECETTLRLLGCPRSAELTPAVFQPGWEERLRAI